MGPGLPSPGPAAGSLRAVADRAPDAPEGSPLAGIRVLDLTQVVSGPFCTAMLANMGAEVVKLEPPGRGDEMRWIGRYAGRRDHEDYFNASNYNKKSIALNLKDPSGRSVGQALAGRADVLVENFSPGTAGRLGMGWDDLHPANPRLVYCSLSGFGQTGPYRNRLAMDPIIQAISGVMSVTGQADGGPVQIGMPLADVIAGMFAAYAVLGALYAVGRDGKGRYLDVSMQAAMVAALGPRMGETLQAGISPRRLGNQNPMRAPSDVYLTSDSVHLFIMVQNDRHWAPFCRALDRPDWIDDSRFAGSEARVVNRDTLNDMVARRFAEVEAADVIPRLEAERVPFSHVNDYAEALADPQIAHRGQIHSLDHPVSGKIRVVGPPWILSGPEPPISPPPTLDQHKTEVLGAWLDWDADRIARFLADGPADRR